MSSSSNSPVSSSLSPRRLRPPLSSSSRDVLEVDDGLISIEEHDALDVHQAEDKRKKKKSKKKSKKSSKRDLIHGVSSSSIDEDGGGGDYAYEDDDDEEEEENDHDGEEESVDASSVPNYVADGLWIQKKSSSSRSISSSSKKKKKKKSSSSSTSSRSLGRSSRSKSSLRSVASSEDGSYLEDGIGGEDGIKRKKKKKSHKRESSSSSSSSKRHREPTSLLVDVQVKHNKRATGGGDGIWVNPSSGNDIRRNAEEQLAFLQSSTDLVDQHMERSHPGTTVPPTTTTTVPKRRDSFMWQGRGNVALATNVWYRRVMSHLCYGTGKRKYWIVGTVFVVSLILTFVLVGSLTNRRFQISTQSPTNAPTGMPSNAPSGSNPGGPLPSSAPTDSSSSSVVMFQGRDCPTSPIYGPLRCAYNEFCVLCSNINELYLCWNQPQPLNRVQFEDACTATMQQSGHPCNPGAAPCPFGNLCVPCNSFAPLNAMTGRVCLTPPEFTRKRNLRQPPPKRRLQGDIFDPPTNPPNTPGAVVTAAPTVLATTVMPVATTIITAQPTTAQPTATMATDTPATPQPTMAPTTPKPTAAVPLAPITPQPTMATTTMSPTLQETTTTTPTAYNRCMTGQP